MLIVFHCAGECTKEELGCNDKIDLLNCTALMKSEECSLPCPLDWKQIDKDCDNKDCAMAVDMKKYFIEMKFVEKIYMQNDL